MTAADHQHWADALERARVRREPIPPISVVEPELSPQDAYAIAQLGVTARVDAGCRIVGHKVGLTSQAVQEQLGVGQPDYGVLLSDMKLENGSTIEVGSMISPRVELELAFHLGEALEGPDVTVEDVQRATAVVQPAIEVVDSRIADWQIRFEDTVADNASSGAFVLGGRAASLAEVDPANVDAGFLRDGQLVEQGNSGAVLGDPRRAVAWLANTLATFGASLEAGHVVLSGACTRMVAASPGESFAGDFGDLGRVEIQFA
jgi:2-keto-4-pentenoate hydratase